MARRVVAPKPTALRFDPITLRLPPDLLQRLDAEAASEERTRSSWLRLVIRRALEAER